MKRKVFSISRGVGWCIFFVFVVFPFCYSPIYAQSTQTNAQTSDSPIQLVMPEEGCMNIAKKAWIKCSVKTPFDPTKLLVLLDGTDISGILDITPEGFEHKSTTLLASGEHTLSVTVTTQDGQELKREFKFSTRHSKQFDEIYSDNKITTLAEKKVVKTGNTVTVPSYKVEANLADESKLKKQEWELKFNTNLRYFNQDMPVIPPPEKGFSLANYLFQAKYTGDRMDFLGEQGDVLINETPNTVQGLARRGGNLVFQSKDLHLQLRTFDVKSEQLFGFKGGPGLGTTPNDHLMGISGDVGLFSDRMRFKTIYASGGEEGGSFGISTTGGPKKGYVLGSLFTTDFFKQKLLTEAELDFSRYDGDTSDEFRANRDKAYRLKVGGTLDKYTYEALYEYMGPDYEVIGNPGLQKNRQGFALKAGANYQIQTVNLFFSRYNDDVNKDDLYPRIYTTQGTIDYTFNMIKNMPIGLSYQRSIQDSSMEPDLTSPVKLYTDTVSGKVEYLKGGWHLTLQASYSVQDDRTPAANDTNTATLTFIPHCGMITLFGKEYLSITPTFSYNRSTSRLTSVDTDTYTTTLDLKGDLFRKRVTYGLGGTYTLLRASDESSKSDTLNTNFNVYYLLVKNLWGFLNPSVGIRGLYNKTNDRVLRQTTDEFALYLVLQTEMSFLF
jgi:hypothetical protein